MIALIVLLIFFISLTLYFNNLDAKEKEIQKQKEEGELNEMKRLNLDRNSYDLYLFNEEIKTISKTNTQLKIAETIAMYRLNNESSSPIFTYDSRNGAIDWGTNRLPSRTKQGMLFLLLNAKKIYQFNYMSKDLYSNLAFSGSLYIYKNKNFVFDHVLALIEPKIFCMQTIIATHGINAPIDLIKLVEINLDYKNIKESLVDERALVEDVIRINAWEENKLHSLELNERMMIWADRKRQELFLQRCLIHGANNVKLLYLLSEHILNRQEVSLVVNGTPIVLKQIS